MKRPFLRCLASLLLGIILTTFIHNILHNNKKQSFSSCQVDSDWDLFSIHPQHLHAQNKITDSCKKSREKNNKLTEVCSQVWKNDIQIINNKKDQKNNPQPCKDCREKIEEMLTNYSKPWVKNEDKHEEIRTWLSLKCSGLENAIITQKNTPLGSKIVYDAERRHHVKVNSLMFATFVKKHPVFNKTLHSCAVVGNGGILANSKCGNKIDSAEFVIRCNLAPLLNGYEEHVGVKTDFVTANPSILTYRYGSLLGSRRRFVESLCQYGDAMLLLPAFSYVVNTALSFRALYTIEDFEMPIQSVFMNPDYLESLAAFWRSHGLLENRLSTGLMMVSLALELCDNVDLYGFWPFGLHPHSFKDLTHHYYDNSEAKKSVHVMSDEFKFLLQLHNQGVLKLHLGECEPEE
ncbi:PREDICTED: alpha-2,8-sialyltransferase 8F-like isoform X1 [Poecilia mexicana]|uniref:alpha-2,8-sialyltransferase 8F-like isoform X1 n=1 Tax=Poecilia mexicana TaxID=48701 RepID=UPI00072DD946|nr:PREDICTED: alpha-2,8-sialyltransferase 8F-like isoform X1 [Poecilia mexicana]XP_014828738.1 PREDICTED: alpha-2,8-sialyltransferase 8F-like isoform X1 [Poecilia mexicana]